MAANNPEISLDNTSRCPKSNLIPSLSCYWNDGKSYINYYCENNHKGAMPLEEYMQKLTIILFPEKSVLNATEIKMKQMELFLFVLNVINF